MAYEPVSLLETVRACYVAVLVAVIAVPATTAPLESVTVPLTSPNCCASISGMMERRKQNSSDVLKHFTSRTISPLEAVNGACDCRAANRRRDSGSRRRDDRNGAQPIDPEHAADVSRHRDAKPNCHRRNRNIRASRCSRDQARIRWVLRQWARVVHSQLQHSLRMRW